MMRRRNLLQTTQNSILCLFCAHRFGLCWNVVPIQQRNPKSTLSADSKIIPSDDPFASDGSSTGPSWGLRSNDDIDPGKSHDVSTETGEMFSSWAIGKAPEWASPITEEDESSTPSTSTIDNNKISKNHESILESSTSAFIKDRPVTRHLNLNPCPGPESSRAGRPAPFVTRRVAGSEDYEYRSGDRVSTSNNTSRQNVTTSGLGEPRSELAELAWGQLKRRVDVHISPKEPSESLDIRAERLRREEESRLKRYTPLSRNSAYKEKKDVSNEIEEIYPARISKALNYNITHPNVAPERVETSSIQPGSDTKVQELAGIINADKTQNLNRQEKTAATLVGDEIYNKDADHRKSFGSKVSIQHNEGDIRSQINHSEEVKLRQSTTVYKPLSELSTSENNILISQSTEASNRFNNNQSIESEQSNSGSNQPTIIEMPSKKTHDSDTTSTTRTFQATELVDEKLSSGRRREKKKRGSDSKPQFNDENTKLAGKDRDRAKREAKFARNKEEQEEIRLLLEEKRDRQRLKAERKAIRKAAPTPIHLPEFITIANLAVAMKVRYEELASKMKELGFKDSHPDVILNSENSGLISMQYNYEPVAEKSENKDLKARDPHPNPSELPSRPPIITIMGHVDHGKTTILDFLRKSSIVAVEHGGITQHIGAFSVRMPCGKMMTFLDTPGHAAFLSMRQRGAYVTDIVILVVAADDGVKPQTIEAIKHAKAAKVPLIVAINKVDKPDVSIEKVKLELARYEVEIEDYGGDTQVVCVSGLTGEGMDKFEETLMALAEVMDLRADAYGPTEGWVLEASVKSLGKVATVLVRRGTLRPGQVLVAGTTWSRVRILRNEMGAEVGEAGPGIPVEVDGWRDQPIAGDEALQAEDEVKAKRVVDYRTRLKVWNSLATDIEAINTVRDETRNLKALAKAAREAAIEEKLTGVVKEIPIIESKPKAEGPKPVYFIVKGDVSGSVEAVSDQVKSLKTKEVEATILRSGVGKVSKFDVEHAAAAKGNIISFNLDIDAEIYHLAEELKVQILESNIIYTLVDNVRAELSRHLPPVISFVVIGEAEIAQIFLINFKGRTRDPVAGCKVRNGSIKRNGRVRVMRDGQKIFDGELSSLKVVGRDVQEVSKGNECGLAFTGWNEFIVGDRIQHYEEKHEKRYL